MTIDPDGSAGAEDDLGAGDSYEQILAAVLREYPETDDVLRQAGILGVEPDRVTLPGVTISTEGIAIDSKCVPLFPQKLDADAVRQVLRRVEGVERREFAETVARGGVSLELQVRLRETLSRAVAFRFMLALLYGIYADETVTEDRETVASMGDAGDGIEPRVPETGRVDVGLYDLGDRIGMGPETEPEQKDRGDRR